MIKKYLCKIYFFLAFAFFLFIFLFVCFIGLALDSLGKHNDAIKCYDESIAINPKDPDYWNNKGIKKKKFEKVNRKMELLYLAYDFPAEN